METVILIFRGRGVCVAGWTLGWGTHKSASRAHKRKAPQRRAHTRETNKHLFSSQLLWVVGRRAPWVPPLVV